MIIPVNKTTYIFLAVFWVVGCSSDSSKIKKALEFVGLAAIPGTAKNVRFAVIGNMLSETYYVRFEQSDKDIKQWVYSSLGLKGINPKEYTESFQLLPNSEISKFRKNDKKVDRSILDADYYVENSKVEWYKPTIKEKGRRYVIKQNQKQYIGEVIIDEGGCSVFIKISKS